MPEPIGIRTMSVSISLAGRLDPEGKLRMLNRLESAFSLPEVGRIDLDVGALDSSPSDLVHFLAMLLASDRLPTPAPELVLWGCSDSLRRAITESGLGPVIQVR